MNTLLKICLGLTSLHLRNGNSVTYTAVVNIKHGRINQVSLTNTPQRQSISRSGQTLNVLAKTGS